MSSRDGTPVSLFIPTEVLNQRPCGAYVATKSPIIGGLPPLREESHLDSLNREQGPSPSSLGIVTTDVDPETAAALTDASLTPIQKIRRYAEVDGYSGVTVELANERWRERWERLCLQSDDAITLPRSSSRMSFASAPERGFRSEAERWRKSPSFQRAEVNLTHAAEGNGVTALVSSWLELDAEDEGVRLDSELALRQELSYAAYLGLEHVVLPAPSSEPSRRQYLADYARAVRNCLQGVAGEAPAAGSRLKVSVRLPISSPHILNTMLKQATHSPGGVPAVPAAAYLRTNDNWAWETWETIQTLCGYHTSLFVALDLSMPLPPATSIARWNAEPVSLLWLPSTSFLANARGYPVLSKSAQSLVRQLIRRRPTIVLSGIANPPAQHTRGGSSAYLQYVRHIERTMPPPSAIETFAAGYGDWLQAPLQPMRDDLSAETYDAFERDPVKYKLYEEAIYKALVERAVPGSTTRIWVFGAGRGMLVGRALEAGRRASRVVHVTAVEKNPHTVVALQDRIVAEWGSDQVDIVIGDMRTLAVPPRESDRADIVVSELLGSFADNELSPECLDGAMRFLKPNGISIPSSYMPFIAPVAAAKLHGDIAHAAVGDTGRVALGMGMPLVAQTGFDSPYVVLLQSANIVSAPGEWPAVQPCWRFEHGPMSNSGLVCTENGLPMTNGHNVRTTINSFHIPHTSVCHGLGGYFQAQLYGDIVLSTYPDERISSPDMVSWFPMFFPFRSPLYLPAGAELQVHMWRLTDDSRVWYEWSAEVFLQLPSVQENTPVITESRDTAQRDSFALPTRPQSLEAGPDTSIVSNAFTNAPNTPMMPAAAVHGGGAVVPGANAASPAAAAAASLTHASSPVSGLGLGGVQMPKSSTVQTASPQQALRKIIPYKNQQQQVHAPAQQPLTRIKIAETDLMNAGAHGSSIAINRS
ncbi:type II protein arginine methyltransferase [Malassezia cuniculi]|uniref:Type II protein arginine methyltransferase n=1 Tax=Malassezia cuniculi TaxID=948313 RepID=A0AAF0F022_9BASI|nr:type II protein arginine methyltransferase [Malassezia cuniculi]